MTADGASRVSIGKVDSHSLTPPGGMWYGREGRLTSYGVRSESEESQKPSDRGSRAGLGQKFLYEAWGGQPKRRGRRRNCPIS